VEDASGSNCREVESFHPNSECRSTGSPRHLMYLLGVGMEINHPQNPKPQGDRQADDVGISRRPLPTSPSKPGCITRISPFLRGCNGINRRTTRDRTRGLQQPITPADPQRGPQIIIHRTAYGFVVDRFLAVLLEKMSKATCGLQSPQISFNMVIISSC